MATFGGVTVNSVPSAGFGLRTFGTLTLIGADDATVLGQHGHHRRRLALLAVLASAGDRGWSRDQLLLFFWPEATQTRARHSLDQLLYALRSSLGDELFAATNPVALNPALISSDVSDFNAAIERGDLEAAARLYRGPFLDGFYLEDAPEFERWVEEERGRLKARYAAALDQLAELADASGDSRAAVGWWRALVEVDPVSTRSALGLMRALKNAGDHAAALHFAEHYEAIVARELGTSVGPDMARLVADVRAAAGTERIALPKVSAEPVPSWTLPMRPNAATSDAAFVVSRRRTSFTRMVIVASTVVAIVAALVATRRGPTDPSTPSIAVLAFTNVTRDAADAALIDALGEDLITALSRIENLRVIARQSSFAFRDSKLTATQIGDSLRVTNLLEGSVQRIGDTYQVQVRLVDAPNGVTRWSKQFKPLRPDIFAMQGEIVGAVARSLNVVLNEHVAQRIRQGPTQNIPAHDLYLRARDPVQMRSPATAAQALQLLQQAVALDSNFAAAYAAMPYMYFVLTGVARDAQEAAEIQRRADAAAKRAIALDPDLPESWTGLAVAQAIGLKDLAGSESSLRKSMALGGSPRVREHLSRVLMWSGRHAESLEQALLAAEEDPLSPTAAADVGEALCANRRIDEGLAQLAKLDSITPQMPRVPGYRALCYLMQQRWASAIAIFDKAKGGDPWSTLTGYAVAKSGDTARALRIEKEAVDNWRRTGRGAIQVVYIAEALGNRDKAIEWLDRAANDITNSIMYPLFSELQADPRFRRHRQRIGLK